MKLTIELVPKTSWYSNVRSQVPKWVWDNIRRKCYRNANYLCEICGDKGTAHPVECHEVWHYNDKKHIQKLTGLIALCPDCHRVKHAGYANAQGLMHMVIEQLMLVNNISSKKAFKHIDEAFNKYRERSKYKWEIDTSFISTYVQDN